MTPSQIGIVLRDSYGVAQVKSVTGNKILRILKTASKSSERQQRQQRASHVQAEYEEYTH